MKRYLTCIAVVLSALLILSGCNKKSGVDTSKMERSFATADSPTKSEADKAVSAVKAQDYQGALMSLQKLAGQAKLTPDQQQAIQDVIAQVQKQVADTVNKAAGEAQKG